MLSCTFSMFWTTVTSQTSSEKSGRTDIQSNRLLCLAQERDSQKGRTRFRVFTKEEVHLDLEHSFAHRLRGARETPRPC